MLPADALGTVCVEVDSDDAILALDAAAAFEVQWVVDPEHEPETLAERVRTMACAEGTVDAFAHGEREWMKALRRALFDEHGLERGQGSLSGYWARGRSEDRFQAEKREPIGQTL